MSPRFHNSSSGYCGRVTQTLKISIYLRINLIGINKKLIHLRDVFTGNRLVWLQGTAWKRNSDAKQGNMRPRVKLEDQSLKGLANRYKR